MRGERNETPGTDRWSDDKTPPQWSTSELNDLETLVREDETNPRSAPASSTAPLPLASRCRLWIVTGGGLVPYLKRLSRAFGWRYVACVILIYGINQGVGVMSTTSRPSCALRQCLCAPTGNRPCLSPARQEPLIFKAEQYYLFDELDVTPSEYGRIDGVTNIPWQVM